MRRNRGNMHGEKYLGNTNEKEVHDLDNETVNCQINEIIAAGHDMPFTSLVVAKLSGFDNCAYCVGNSLR